MSSAFDRKTLLVSTTVWGMSSWLTNLTVVPTEDQQTIKLSSGAFTVHFRLFKFFSVYGMHVAVSRNKDTKAEGKILSKLCV